VKDQLPAVVLDTKGNIELLDYHLRGKVVTANKAQPGATIDVPGEATERVVSQLGPGQPRASVQALRPYRSLHPSGTAACR